MYKQRAFDLLATDQVDEAKKAAAAAEAMHEVGRAVDQALRRIGEEVE